MLRQGDILLINVIDTPAHHIIRDTDRAVLGYGEATGHTHTMDNVQWLVAPETTAADLQQFALGEKQMPVFVVVSENTELKHQEHDVITVPPGVWQVVRQREYTPQAIRMVVD